VDRGLLRYEEAEVHIGGVGGGQILNWSEI
jgi:hypothetical protein